MIVSCDQVTVGGALGLYAKSAYTCFHVDQRTEFVFSVFNMRKMFKDKSNKEFMAVDGE